MVGTTVHTSVRDTQERCLARGRPAAGAADPALRGPEGLLQRLLLPSPLKTPCLSLELSVPVVRRGPGWEGLQCGRLLAASSRREPGVQASRRAGTPALSPAP